MEEKIPRFIHHIGVVLAEAVCQGIADYEASARGQDFTTYRPVAAASPTGHLPAPVVARIAEVVDSVQSPDFAISLAARLFGYPEDFVRAELEEYRESGRRAETG